jgi:hypothetical protein
MFADTASAMPSQPEQHRLALGRYLSRKRPQGQAGFTHAG